jgi:plastocyanin
MALGFRKPAFETPIGGERDGGFVSTRPGFILVVLAILLALALSACGPSDASTRDTAADTEGRTVVIEDMAFAPETLTVEAGDTVTWVWKDGAIDHDVAGDNLKSEVMSEGTFTHRFDQPGTYDYVCTLHPNMTGTIEVIG